MLRKIRVMAAALCFTLVTLLFLDFTGTAHAWFGWLAKIQFLPAVLALNVAVVLCLVLLTLFFGRVYCSVICPLGVWQDIVNWVSARRKGKKARFSYAEEKKAVRYGVLALFVVLMIAGLNSIAILVAPYSAWGRIAGSLFAPVWACGNNLLAYVAERANSYAFYEVDVWLKSAPVLVVAIVSLLVVSVLAWKGGRTYCNTICPVGTVLGLISRFAVFKPVINTDACVNCGLCGKKCKAQAIDTKNHTIDYSRCVMCMDCLENCNKSALLLKAGMPSLKAAAQANASESKQECGAPENAGRRAFLVGAGVALAAAAQAQKNKKVDGGLAVIEDKEIPERNTPILPPGAFSAKHFAQHCTGCQLCVQACPNGVLRPSNGLMTLMQPEMQYDRGYCRPECTKCGEVCPTGAIKPITRAEKSSTQIGHAVWVKKNCVVLTDDVDCGNCARHCPNGAILMVESKDGGRKIPVVNTERCIGCGACENLCPSRPFSAIYVEGHEMQKEI